MKQILSESMRIKRHRNSIMLRLSTIFLIVFVWSAVVLPLEPCAAADEDVDPLVECVYCKYGTLSGLERQNHSVSGGPHILVRCCCDM